jgi:fumarate hydratase class II
VGLNAHPELAVAWRAFAPRRARRSDAANPFGDRGARRGRARGRAGAPRRVLKSWRRALLASGPRAGLAEIRIPENEPGSSIMPGKVNPTQCEALSMVALRVFGNDAAVAIAGSQGSLELNVYKPLMADGVLESIGLLADGCESFDRHCAAGIEADVARMQELVRSSLMLVTALVPAIGYDRAAAIARKAHAERLTLRDAALALGMAAEEFDRAVVPERMTAPSLD